MFCIYCGADNPHQATFCASCGRQLERAASTTVQPFEALGPDTNAPEQTPPPGSQAPSTPPPPPFVAQRIEPQGPFPPPPISAEQQGQRRRRLPAGITVLLLVLAVLLIGGSGLIYYATVYQPNLKHAQATATALAHITGTAHAEATAAAQATAAVVATQTALVAGLTVYTGKGYSIGYPQGWKVTPSSNQVTLTGASGVYNLGIFVSPNPNGIADASTVANKVIEAVKKQMKNPQTETLPATTTVGGDSWVQKSITGTGISNGQSVDIQVVVISDNHPANSANTQNFTIAYATEKSLFATANTSYFQPMLQSFKFT